MLLSSTVSPVDDGRQSEAAFIHTISGSLNVNNLLALPSEYASKDIPNKDDAEDDDFPISHDDAYDGSVDSDTSCTLSDEESPTLLPADNTATKNDVADGSILDAFVAHSESINDGLSLSLFSVWRRIAFMHKHTPPWWPDLRGTRRGLRTWWSDRVGTISIIGSSGPLTCCCRAGGCGLGFSAFTLALSDILWVEKFEQKVGLLVSSGRSTKRNVGEVCEDVGGLH